MPVASRSTGPYHPQTAGRPLSGDGAVGPPDPGCGCGSDSRLRVPAAVRIVATPRGLQGGAEHSCRAGSVCTCPAQAGMANCIELHDQHRRNRRPLTAHPRHPWLNLNGSRVRFGRQPKPDQYKRTASKLTTKFHEGLR